MRITALLAAVLLVMTLSACTATEKDPALATPQPAAEQSPIPTGTVPAPTEEIPAPAENVPAPAQEIPTPTENVPAVADVPTEKTLTRDEAIALALAAAGMERNAVRELEAEKDWERGTLVWEVDFESGAYEYSYVLDAKTGDILYWETERD